MKIKEKISDLVWPVKRTWRKIKRVIDFLPILWNGYDFDYRYAVELFQYQLNRTADYLDSDRSWTENASSRAKRIRTVTELMEKVYDEEYATEYQAKLRELYGDDVLNWHWVPLNAEELDKIPEDWKPEYDELVKQKWGYEFWDNSDEVEEVKDKLFKESHKKQERAHKLLWELIAHNIRHWWD